MLFGLIKLAYRPKTYKKNTRGYEKRKMVGEVEGSFMWIAIGSIVVTALIVIRDMAVARIRTEVELKKKK